MSRSKIVGYVRVSGESQLDGYGLEVQEEALDKYCTEHNYQLVKIFREEGVSGSLLDRPALADLIEYCNANPKAFGIGFLRLDRLARDLLVQEQLIADFQSKGIKLHCLEDPDLSSSDPSRKLFRQIKGAISEFERDMITLRLTAGRRKKVSNGKGYSGGKLPFAFELVNGDYSLVPSETKIVKEIYQLRRKPKLGKRLSYQKIAELLNTKYSAKLNRSFNAMTIHYIANNKIYRGIQSYSGLEVKQPHLAIL